MERKLQELQGEPGCQKQMKVLTSELETFKETGMQASESLQTPEMVNLKLEKQNKFKNWELNDFVAVRNAWCEELSHSAKEKDAVSASVKAQIEQLEKLRKQIRKLQLGHKSLEGKLRGREWNHCVCLREKDALVKKYKQLSMADEQEQLLEQSKTQAELDWQLYETAENNWYQKSEDLKESLSLSREQVEAGLQTTDYRLHELETVPSAFSIEREQTIQSSLSCHGVLSEGEKQIFQYGNKSYCRKEIPTLEIQKLQEQNASLRAAIAQMRKEMESLDEQTLPSLSLTEQTVTGLTTETSSLTPGLLRTDQVSVRTTLSNKNVSSANLGCTVKADTEKGSKNKVIDKKMIGFGSTSDNCCPGVGLQRGVSCTLQGPQNKLKEAARKISTLSQEKQQLIEMRNRLRADLGMVLQEELRHPISFKRCTVCVDSGSLSPQELVKRTQCQLSAVKHLQHQLVTQELQYAKEHHLSKVSVIACPVLKREKVLSSCEEEKELLSAEVQLDFSTGNYGPKQQKTDTCSKMIQSQPLRKSPSQACEVWISSPTTHGSCQGIWQTLEMESSSFLRSENNTKKELPVDALDEASPTHFTTDLMSPGGFLKELKLLQPTTLSPFHNTEVALEFEVTCSTKQSEESQENIKAKDKLVMPAADLTIRGTKMEVQQKLKFRNLPCTYPIKQKISSNVAKIRNYNIKD